MHNGPAHIAIIFIHSQSVCSSVDSADVRRTPLIIVDDSMDFRFQQMFRRGDDYHHEIILLAWNGNNCTKSKCQMTISEFFHRSSIPMSTDWPQMKLCNWMATKDIFDSNEKLFRKNQFSSLWIYHQMEKQPSPDHITCHISQFPSFVCQMRSSHAQKSVISFRVSNNVVHNKRATGQACTRNQNK